MNADIVVEDREGRPVLLALVKGVAASASDFGELLAEMNASIPAVPFGMVVDPDRIRVFEADCERPLSNVVEFPTAEVLGHYTTHFEESKTFRISPRELADFFKVLVEVWIDDLAYEWKSGEPPKKSVFVEVGILPRIARRARAEKDLIGGDSLR